MEVHTCENQLFTHKCVTLFQISLEIKRWNLKQRKCTITIWDKRNQTNLPHETEGVYLTDLVCTEMGARAHGLGRKDIFHVLRQNKYFGRGHHWPTKLTLLLLYFWRSCSIRWCDTWRGPGILQAQRPNTRCAVRSDTAQTAQDMDAFHKQRKSWNRSRKYSLVFSINFA